MAVDTKSTRPEASRSDRKPVNAYQFNCCGDNHDTKIRDFHTCGLHENLVSRLRVIQRKVPLCQHHAACIRKPTNPLPKILMLCGCLLNIRFVTDRHLNDLVSSEQNQNATESDVILKIENQHIKVNYPGGANSQFTYDGFGHLVKIVDSTGSTKQFIWSGTIRLEARGNSGSLVSQYFANGQTIGGTNYFYFKDHLGSVREMADGSGNLQAQYEYDPYGRSYKVQGGLNSDMQYAGYYFHVASGQSLAGVRAYNSSLGRWTSRDQIEEIGGLNLYAYVNNAPINLLDSTGTLPFSPGGPPAKFGHDVGIDPYFIVRNGCIGIVQALQGQKPGSGPNGGGKSPEKYGDTHCFRTKKEAEDYKCCNGQPPKVIFAKQGKWANGTGPVPVPLPGNEIAPGSVADNGGSFNYVVDDPGPPQQYIWANGAACYVKYQQVFVSPYPPGGQQADAEEWCTTCK